MKKNKKTTATDSKSQNATTDSKSQVSVCKLSLSELENVSGGGFVLAE